MDPGELFCNLESWTPQLAEDAKKRLQQTLNSTRESWLLNGIYEYYLATDSPRSIEVLVSVREPHDKYLFDRMLDGLKGSGKLQALTVLGHLLRKQPGWLYRISSHPLLKELLKLLKTEMEILPLLSALLALVVLLPMIPSLMGPYLQDIFDIFSRLAAWNCNPGRLAEEQLVHLQVAMYALFLRLYGMYPCNFISYLRNHYRQSDNKPVFTHTVRPMLSTVLIHPHLVTDSKDNETETVRWKKMGHHDVIVECERFAVDTAERNREEGCFSSSLTSSFRSRSGTDHSSESSPFTLPNLKFPICSSGVSGAGDFWSPSMFFYQHSNSPPPLPEVTAPTSIPQTPNSISSSVFPQQEGTSPPEAAIEATPETTPIKDLRPRAVPPINSTVARALTSLTASTSAQRWHNLPSSTSTPSCSQPSSPMRKDPSPFRFPQEGSAFEINARNKGMSQKIAKLIEDRSQAVDVYPRRTPVPTSPLRLIRQETTGSVPNSPVPVQEAKTERSIVSPVTPGGADQSQEDQEVLEIVRRGEQLGEKAARQCDSVLQEFQVSQDEEYDECEQEHGSPCASGGLHMPNSHSLQAFATRVKRLRYYSQCAPDTVRSNDQNGQFSHPNPIKVRRANSCPEMKKNYPILPDSLPSLPHALDESDELSIESSSTPVPCNGIGLPCTVPRVSTATQTLELWPLPYEHLFLGVFPAPEGEVRGQSPAESKIRFSPYEMLDKYIEHAAHMADNSQASYKLGSHHLETEVKNMREQLGLLHIQLQYERHRREVHAVRNRRLLGESRNNKALEEHNSALRDQLSLLQKEIENLHDQLNHRKQESNMRERELQEIVSFWHGQCLRANDENKLLKEKNDALEKSLTEKQLQMKDILDRSQKKDAQLFQVESEMEIALVQARDTQRIMTDLERMRTELLLAGEINQRYREKLDQLSLVSHKEDEIALITSAYHEEISNLSQQLESKTAQLESCKAHVQELESQSREYDEMCASQKRMLKEVKEQYHEQLQAIQSKYDTQRAINSCMEERALELWNRIDQLSASQRRPHVSPDTSSCHEAMGHSGPQVVSPHSSPPLSASLASSEGSMRQYLLQHSSNSATQHQEIKNLQVILNQTESDSRTSVQLSSEESTPDGTTRSLNSLNHSE